MDHRASLRNPSIATLNIRSSITKIAEVDPLKHGFRTLFSYLPPSARGHVVAGLGELIGTLMFIFMAMSGVQVGIITSNRTAKGNIDSSIAGATPQGLLYISLSVGFSLLVTAWIFFRISGALFNPVVSLAMVLIGALTVARGALLIVVQVVATITAAYMVAALFPVELNVGTALHPDVTVAQGVLVEMILTSLVVFTILMLAAEQHEATFLAPVGIGLAAFLAHLIGVFWPGASLNPARSLAPAIVTGSFPDHHWIYYVGPISGAILAVIFYKLIKALEYETIHETDGAISPTLPTARDDMVHKNAVLNSVQIGNAGQTGQAVPTVRKPVPPPPKDENTAGLPSADHD